VGLNTTLSFTWTENGSIPTVTITSPSGVVTTDAYALLLTAFSTLEFHLSGIAEVRATVETVDVVVIFLFYLSRSVDGRIR
jgi:hypothetical protein